MILNSPKNIWRLIAVIFTFVFTACGVDDGDVVINEVVDSPYYIKLKQESTFLDLKHGINYQSEPDISIPNICDWLYNNCSNNLDTFYFASSFGDDEIGDFNFVITNFPYSSKEGLRNKKSNLSDLLKNLPSQNGYANLAEGTLNNGIQNGNVYIGKKNYKYGYAYAQPDYSHFRILEVNDEKLFDQNVVGIRFAFEYKAYNENGQSVIISQGEGYLPFGLHGQE